MSENEKGFEEPLCESIGLGLSDSCCPLCSAPSVILYHKDSSRGYYRCAVCGLVYVPAAFHLTVKEQRSRYDLHKNSPDDSGYRTFLSKIVVPLSDKIPAGAIGLDFGSGPGPTLHTLFKELGFKVFNYDPLYAPNSVLLNSVYDFVSSTETVEHFCAPSADWSTLFSLVKRTGVLGVMTYRLPIEPASFASWRYKDDPTHVAFYSKKTFLWLARKYAAVPEFVGDSVVIFSF